MSEQFIISKDGLKLYTKEWHLDKPKAVICLIHGFGEHINRYDHFASFFNKNGYTVVGMDHRGHGKSEGKRGHTPQYESYLDDIETVLNHVRSLYKGIPVFLYGHSMGGNIVLSYLTLRNPSLKGVIATGPWVRLAFEPKPFLLTLGKLMRSIFPSFTQDSGLKVTSISKDKAVVEAYEKDPLVHAQITASAGVGITEAAARLNELSTTVSVPLLIMHGDEDLLTSQPASEEFANRTKGDVTYKKWQSMYHEIHNEPDQLQVFEYTLKWLDSKINE